MELLDDNIGDISGELSKERIQEVFALRKEHSELSKSIFHARVALTIITVFSLIALLIMFSTVNDSLTLGITSAIVLIFGICAATPHHYARISLPIALGLYILDLLGSFIEPSAMLIFGLIIKGVFIYFIVKGIMAAFKYNDLTDKMERLNITPYKN